MTDAPAFANADSAPFWQSCREHRMRLQQCAECTRFRYPPRPVCPHCLSADSAWREVSGQGTVYVSLESFRPAPPGLESADSFNLSMIELSEGVRMWANVIGCPPGEVRIGDHVEVCYLDTDSDIGTDSDTGTDSDSDTATIPAFRLAGSSNLSGSSSAGTEAQTG